MINVEIKNNIRFPELKLQSDLEHIAEKIFIPYMKRQILNEQDLNENKYAPLAESTLKRKKVPKILYETGALFRSFFSTKLGKDTVKISLTSDRKELGNILQNLGVRSKAHGGKRYFEFFGISRQMEGEAMTYIKTRVNEELKSAKS